MMDMVADSKKLPDTLIYASISSNTSLLFTIYSIITGILILHFRHWDPEILKQTLGIIAYPIFFFGTVAIAISHDLINKYVIPICLFAFMLLPLIVSLIGVWILIPLGILGIYFTAWSCWLTKNASSSRDLIKLLSASIFLTVFYFFVLNGCNYADIYGDLKGLQGDLGKDTLFHSAIINMLARFGVPSTGLDGVPPIVYHIGVHRWVATNLLVLGGETPILLAIAKQVALIPTFFFTVVHVVTRLSDRSSSFITTLGFTFAILWLTGSRVWNSYLLSESYLFSLSVFVAMLPVGRSWIAQSLKTKLLNVVKPWEIAIALIAIAACWAAKISTGIILGVYLIACVLSPKLLANPRHIITAIFPLIGLGILGLLAVNKFYLGIPFSFSPFHFARGYTALFCWQIIIFCISISAFSLFKSKSEQELRFPIGLTLLVTFVAGQIPGILLHVGGGGAFYFSDPALLVALIYGTSALATSWPHQSLDGPTIGIDDRLRKIFLPYESWKRFQFSFGYIFLALSLIIVLVSSSASKSYDKYVLNFIALVQKDSSSFPSTGQFKLKRVLYRFQDIFHDLISPPKINKDILLSQTPIGRIKSSIADLALSKADKSLAIYISPSYQDFWTSRPRCWEPSFTVPALIGLPLLNGVRNGLGNCEPMQFYGMKYYGKSSLNYQLSPTDICTNAKKLGFIKVYEITENKNQMHSCVVTSSAN